MTAPARPIQSCHLPWEWLAIGPKGDVQPCCWASEAVGHLQVETIEEIWNGPKMVRLRQSIRDGFIDSVCRHAGCRFVIETERDFGIESYDYRVALEEQITLSSLGRSSFCASGWSRQEAWGVWSDSSTATMLLDLPTGLYCDLRLSVCGRGAFQADGTPTRVEVSVNGRPAGAWMFSGPEECLSNVWREIFIPAAWLEGSRLVLTFTTTLTSPATSGGADARKLGFGVAALQVSLPLRSAPRAPPPIVKDTAGSPPSSLLERLKTRFRW